MVKKAGDYQVPYTREGNLMSYPSNMYGYDPISGDYLSIPPLWVDNEPFDAEMELISFARGRSAANFMWKKLDDGRTFPMFMSDMVDLIKYAELDHGKTLRLRWIVKKKGQNYGLAVLQE